MLKVDVDISKFWGSGITLTFGDVAENHKSMQKIGTLAVEGFSYDGFFEIHAKYDFVDFYNLSSPMTAEISVDKACVIVIKNGIENLFNINKEELMSEQLSFEYDEYFYDAKKQKILKKHACKNPCFAEEGQESDLDKGKGTIIQ